MAKSVGRGFLDFNSVGEQNAFGAWFKEELVRCGGRNKVMETSGVSGDMLSKYVAGRAVPSKSTLFKLMDAGVIQYASPEDLAAHAPWLAPKYIKLVSPKKAKAQPAAELALNPETAPEPEIIGSNLMDAIMTEPHITAKQRAQLAALAAMIVNGVDLQIQISPRS